MWKTVKLGEIATWVRGLTYSKRDEVESNGTAVLRATNIDLSTSKLVLDEIRYVSETVKVKNDKYTKVGDLLVCTASGSKSHVGKVAIIEEDLGMAFGGFMAALRCNENCIPKFLYYVLTSQKFKQHLKSLEDGANINNLKFSQIEDYELLLPPLAEQERIVAKLDAAFAKIDEAIKISQDRKAKLDIFKASVINNAFQKLDNEIHMGEIFKFVRGPFGGSLKKNIFLEKGFAVYEQKHAIKNQCNDFRYFISQDKFNEMSRFKVTPNSILMSCSGTIGKTTIVPENPTAGIINQALLMIQPSESVLPNFTKLFMESTRFSEQLMDTVGGAAQKNVASVKVLKEISMPIPHIEDQQEIVSRITQIVRSIETLNKTKEDTIKKYLMLKSAILKQELQSSEAA